MQDSSSSYDQSPNYGGDRVSALLPGTNSISNIAGTICEKVFDADPPRRLVLRDRPGYPTVPYRTLTVNGRKLERIRWGQGKLGLKSVENFSRAAKAEEVVDGDCDLGGRGTCKGGRVRAHGRGGI